MLCRAASQREALVCIVMQYVCRYGPVHLHWDAARVQSRDQCDRRSPGQCINVSVKAGPDDRRKSGPSVRPAWSKPGASLEQWDLDATGDRQARPVGGMCKCVEDVV